MYKILALAINTRIEKILIEEDGIIREGKLLDTVLDNKGDLVALVFDINQSIHTIYDNEINEYYVIENRILSIVLN